jgi:hypothetical protein
MIIITGSFRAPDGQPCTGEVDFALSVPETDEATVVEPVTVTGRLGAVTPGFMAVELARNDSLTPSGSFYTVTERIDQYGNLSYPVTLTAALGLTADISVLRP